MRARPLFRAVADGVSASERGDEAAIGGAATGVSRVQPREHRPGALRPCESIRGARPAHGLYVAAVVHVVARPGAGIVLDAGDLDDRHVTRRGEAAYPVAVGVPGEVAGDGAAARDQRAQRLAVVGIDAEVV